MKMKGVEKAGLKLSIQKTKIIASDPITSWQIDGGNVERMTDFYFLGLKANSCAQHTMRPNNTKTLASGKEKSSLWGHARRGMVHALKTQNSPKAFGKALLYE